MRVETGARDGCAEYKTLFNDLYDGCLKKKRICISDIC